MTRVLLVASTTGYQVREFGAAAQKLGYELVLATDRCHILPDPWGDDAAPIRFDHPEPWFEELAQRGPFDGIVAVGDRPAQIASEIAVRFGLRFHSPHAAKAAGDKLETRQRFREAGLLTPEFQRLPTAEHAIRFPCVLKPLSQSASRGVIRANTPHEFTQAKLRIEAMLGQSAELLVEDYIPGREFAVEGLVRNGILSVLALFDKPDPLEGPFFEETIYTTPSREPDRLQCAIRSTTQAAVTALGLSDGPVHAEMRVNETGVWMLEIAARPIGGLCSRVLRFQDGATLEETLLRHAAGSDVSQTQLAGGAHGVMMIPIPRAGIYQGVSGVSEATNVFGIEDVVITAKEGQALVPLPEGSSYLGFIFARTESPAQAEAALRESHVRLFFHLTEVLPVVR